jgi:dTDP-4-dehydrorhamnose reductase
MRILLTGKNGQVGFELQRALAPLGELLALDRSQCDLSRPEALRTLIREARPDVIVNAAAHTAVDRAETETGLAMAVNAHAPGVLGEEAQRLGALVVHFSTDYVFDGTQDAPYTEADPPNPQSAYGASKWAGEQALQASGARHVIFRTSWVAGAHGGNFAKTMLRLATERNSLAVVADQFGAPTSAALLADVTALLLRDATQEPDAFAYGLYHLAASGSTNWHAYACYVIDRARAAGWPVKVAPQAIRAIRSDEYQTPARRPANSRLDTRRLCTTFDLHMPHWTCGIDHLLEQILQ